MKKIIVLGVAIVASFIAGHFAFPETGSETRTEMGSVCHEVIVTDDGHMWTVDDVRCNFSSETRKEIKFDTKGTADVQDDIILAVGRIRIQED